MCPLFWRAESLPKLFIILVLGRLVFPPDLFIHSIIYIGMNSRIFISLQVIIQNNLFIVLLQLFQFWHLETRSVSIYPMLCGFLPFPFLLFFLHPFLPFSPPSLCSLAFLLSSISLLFGTTRCSRLLYISCCRPRTYYFSTKVWFPLSKNGIRNQNLGAVCPCYS